MSRTAAISLAGHPGIAYPERRLDRVQWYERLWHDTRGRATRAWTARPGRFTGIVDAVNALERSCTGLDAETLRTRARDAGRRLRVEGFHQAAAAAAFALVREASRQHSGMRHHDVQLVGGWIMLNGLVAEMQTGEGKTLTATLTAAAAALTGFSVHVVTVNDYLAQRDAESMRATYEALGLQVGIIVHGMTPDERRAAYRCDVVYCSNKELAFDFLRDRIALGSHGRRLGVRVADLRNGRRLREDLVLRGLYFAIVDEADSVLVDEARTPLIISREEASDDAAVLFEEALNLARPLERDVDFTIDARARRVRITARGLTRLAASGAGRGGIWTGPRRREELVSQALSALHLFRCDVHYVVRDDAIQIVDEYTGRVLEGRSWERGLHQMVEAKEGVPVTGRKAALARTTYQGFFRRYLHLAGMTGTARELARELWSVYGLQVVPVPTHRPCVRQRLPAVICADAERQWVQVCESVRTAHAAGQPVLLGTRSVSASESASTALDAADIAHRVLNANQDAEEAAIVAAAGVAGAVTVATNMAGRGTDIKLESPATAAGGLHVVVTALHDARRIDRQLIGRCARQGDPGSYRVVLSLDDDLARAFGRAFILRLLRTWVEVPAGRWLAGLYLRSVQARAERYHAGIRRDLVRSDERLEETLAFSGRSET